MKWFSQAPANTMLLGEHSVVYGHPALACALNQFITIDWQQRTDQRICIRSNLAQENTHLERLSDPTCDHPKLRFVLGALRAFQPDLRHCNIGLDIDIHSDFSSTIGLGSSAAVLAAMLVGLNAITQKNLSVLELFALGHKQILVIQGRGSGTDLAASLYGGLIHFQPSSSATNNVSVNIVKLNANALFSTLNLHLIYAGYKTPTAQVLEQVAAQWQHQPAQLKALYAQMGQTTQRAYQVLTHHNLNSPNGLSEFFNACYHYQTLMTQLGVTDTTLQAILNQLAHTPNVCCAKISGSGLGDCVLALSHDTNDQAWSNAAVFQDFQTLSVQLTDQGAFAKRNVD